MGTGIIHTIGIITIAITAIITIGITAIIIVIGDMFVTTATGS